MEIFKELSGLDSPEEITKILSFPTKNKKQETTLKKLGCGQPPASDW
jgi:hypothetical protein